MAEPTSTAMVAGASISTAATYLLGPLVGEFAIIIGMGLLGTLVSLIDQDELTHSDSAWDSAWKALKVIFRGVVLSFVFAEILDQVVVSVIPKEYGLGPYAMLSVVSFVIGWTNNKWGIVKDKVVNAIGDKLAAIFGGNK